MYLDHIEEEMLNIERISLRTYPKSFRAGDDAYGRKILTGIRIVDPVVTLVQGSTIQYNTVQYNTIKYNTTQYNLCSAQGRMQIEVVNRAVY